jgi:hypothetical protein
LAAAWLKLLSVMWYWWLYSCSCFKIVFLAISFLKTERSVLMPTEIVFDPILVFFL